MGSPGSPPRLSHSSRTLWWQWVLVQCWFASHRDHKDDRRLGAQNGYLDSHTASELCGDSELKYNVNGVHRDPYGLLGTDSPGRPPRFSHSFWAPEVGCPHQVIFGAPGLFCKLADNQLRQYHKLDLWGQPWNAEEEVQTCRSLRTTLERWRSSDPLLGMGPRCNGRLGMKTPERGYPVSYNGLGCLYSERQCVRQLNRISAPLTQ